MADALRDLELPAPGVADESAPAGFSVEIDAVTGPLKIAVGETLTVQGSVTDPVTFEGGNGVFAPADAADMAGVILGFQPSDAIDLTGVAYDPLGTEALLQGNILEISENSEVFDFRFDPNQLFFPNDDTFNVAADPGGGTEITLQQTPITSYVLLPQNDDATGVAVGRGGTLDVQQNATLNGSTVDDGGDEIIDVGGSANDVVLNGGFLTNFGAVSGTVVGAGGELSDSGQALATTLEAGGGAVITGAADELLDISAATGGVVTFADAGGVLQLDGTTVPNVTVDSFRPGDSIDLTGAAYDAAATATRLASGVLEINEVSGTYDVALTPTQAFLGESFVLAPDAAGGTQLTLAAGTLNTLAALPSGDFDLNVNVGAGGEIDVQSGATLIAATVTGGKIVVESGGAANTATLEAGASMEVSSGGDAQFVAFAQPGAALQFDGTNIPATQIFNFAAGDTITLANHAHETGYVAANGQLSVSFADGATVNLNLANATPTSTYDFSAFGADGTTISIPCFKRDTRILTERGEIAVQDLRVGDLALTAGGAHRPIVWLGHRRVDISRHPDPAGVNPVRVRAGAFGAGLPRRDLWLSPGHNVACDGLLMPISCLVNGASVAQIERREIEYWHVELDAHDVIFAEGLPSESYLDTGNRNAFANGGAFVEAHPDFRPRHWAETCLPLVREGPAVAAVKSRLLAQAGVTIVREADAHVIIDGLRIEPIRFSDKRLGFTLPPGGRDIALRSRTFVPAHTRPDSQDTRTLGLSVARLMIDGEDVALDNDAICASGWWGAEFPQGRFSHRWTKGATPLRAGARMVIVDLYGLGYYLAEPEAPRALQSA